MRFQMDSMKRAWFVAFMFAMVATSFAMGILFMIVGEKLGDFGLEIFFAGFLVGFVIEALLFIYAIGFFKEVEW